MRLTLVRRTAVAVAAATLMLSAAAPVEAAKRKPKKTTFYLHGTQALGESQWPDTWLGDLWMKMDETTVEDPAPKSMFVTNYGGGPNTNCSGNGLLPVWQGNMSGKLVGDVKLTLNTVATPTAQIVARLYPDASGGCNEAHIPPAAEIVAVAPPGSGTTEFVFEDVNIPVVARMVVQLHIQGVSPAQVRILYDGASYQSTFEFTCVPAKKAKSCF